MDQLSPSELSILLVEPSAMQQKVISGFLNNEDATLIETAKTMKEAIDNVKSHTPDLVISAMYLKDGTALDLIRTLRENEEHKDIPFMLVSSEWKKDMLEEYKQSGVVAILPKPFSRQHLARALNATIDILTPDELELDLFDIHEVRTLIVDDSITSRNHIRRVLGNLGIKKTSEAENGLQAIELLKSKMFDLVVTDYNMPEMDGRQLSEYIRNSSEQSHIPILMVTSEASETHLAHIEQSGVNALTDKPFEPENIRNIVYALLEQA